MFPVQKGLELQISRLGSLLLSLSFLFALVAFIVTQAGLIRDKAETVWHARGGDDRHVGTYKHDDRDCGRSHSDAWP
jgi:hypothetical protein